MDAKKVGRNKLKKFPIRVKYPDGHETIEDAQYLGIYEEMHAFKLYTI